MIIDGHTRVCGLIGDPVEHTSSPAIHNTLANICGHNLVYVPLQVKRGKVADAVKGAYELNVLGLNVTVPHKLEVIDCLVGIDSLAETIGAVNTLVRTEGGYIGYNTDILGLERAILSEISTLQNETVVLLGAGGAARAVAFLMVRMKASKLYILNRTFGKAKTLADEINEYAGCILAYPMELSDYANIEEERLAVIQATSIGLSPYDDQVVLEAPEFYKKIFFGYDLVYRPAETKFMKLVSEYGQGKAVNGLKMLLYQGIIAYELWNDVHISEECAAKVYEALEETVRR